MALEIEFQDELLKKIAESARSQRSHPALKNKVKTTRLMC